MPSVVPRTKTISLASAALRKRLSGLARCLVRVGGTPAQGMHATMDVGILFDVVVHQGVEHCLRLLRRRGVVEVDQWLAVDALPQDWEIPPDRR